MSLRPRPLIPAAAALLLALAIGACGGEANGTGDAPASGAADSGLRHVHGLGLAGDTLYIATHSGLWAAPAGQTKARRVGSSRQDVMGFSVPEAGRFIGSGHPAPDQDLPPNLGLIESRDGGRTWRNLSLEGEADFHVLESAESRVYGFDGGGGRLMVSSDGGRTWDERKPPAGMFALAIDPRSADKLVTSTEAGLFRSSDAGRTWSSLRLRTAGLFAWPARDRLYLVNGEGQVQRSADAGRTWSASGMIGGPPAAFAADGDDLYAALADGTVKQSSDGGRSWTLRVTP